MRYLTLGEVVALHRAIIDTSGGASGVRDLAALESALAQPRATFAGSDLHPSIAAKAAALGRSLALNHRGEHVLLSEPSEKVITFSVIKHVFAERAVSGSSPSDSLTDGGSPAAAVCFVRSALFSHRPPSGAAA